MSEKSSCGRKVSAFSLPALFVVATLGLTTGTGWADCPDTILDPGDDTSVHYHNNHLTITGCAKLGSNKTWGIPDNSGEKCAASRIDGCSLHESKYLFTERDKKLMTPACNEHDLCYSTYGTSKLGCDGELGKNLDAIKRKFNGSFQTGVVVSAVLLLGDHQAGQNWGKDHNCSK